MHLKAKADQARKESDDAAGKKINLETTISGLDRRIGVETNRLKSMQSAGDRRMQKLRQMKPDAAKALEYLRSGEFRARSKFYEPPIMTLDIPNEQHKKIVEQVRARQIIVSCFTNRIPSKKKSLKKKMK